MEAPILQQSQEGQQCQYPNRNQLRPYELLATVLAKEASHRPWQPQPQQRQEEPPLQQDNSPASGGSGDEQDKVPTSGGSGDRQSAEAQKRARMAQLRARVITAQTDESVQELLEAEMSQLSRVTGRHPTRSHGTYTDNRSRVSELPAARLAELEELFGVVGRWEAFPSQPLFEDPKEAITCANVLAAQQLHGEV